MLENVVQFYNILRILSMAGGDVAGAPTEVSGAKKSHPRRGGWLLAVDMGLTIIINEAAKLNVHVVKVSH